MARILFEIVAEDVGVAKRLEVLRQTIKDLNKDIKGANEGSQEYEVLANKIADAKIEAAKLIETQKALNREFKAAQVPTDSLAGMRLQYSALVETITKFSAAQRESDFGQKLIAQAKQYKDEINNIEESLGRFTGSVGNYKKALISIGDIVTAGLLTGGIEKAVELVSGAVFKGVDALAEYGAALDNLSSLTGVTGNELETLRQKAEELTNIKIGDSELVNTPQKIFEGFKLVGSAQPELLESAEALKTVSKDAIVLSAASGDLLPASVEALTTVLGQFQLQASESTRVVNELAAGAKLGASEIPNTTEALQKFGTTAAVANVSTSESIALVQTLADQQLKGAEAGIQLRNVLVKLSAADALPTKAIETFKAAGVNVKVLTDSTLPLGERLQELSKLAGDTGALVKVFGTENLTAAQILTQNVEKFKTFADGIQGTNEAYKQAEINSGNLKTQLANLEKEGLNTLTDGFRTFEPVIVFFVEALARAFGIVGGFLSVLKELPRFVKDNKVELAALATGIAILNGEMIVASANALRLAAAQRIQTLVTSITTAAQYALNVALTANPIGLIVVAIAALVLGFKEAYKSSQTFRASIEGLGNVVTELFKIIKESADAFITGFSKLNEGDFTGALEAFGEGIKKSNPIGIALTQGERLKNAFNQGFDNKVAEENRQKAEDERDERQVESAKAKAEKIKKTNQETTASAEAAAKRQKEASEEAAKATEEQLKRIKQTLEELRSLQREAITNDFDRQISEAGERRLNLIEKVEERRKALEAKIKAQKGNQTSSDFTEAQFIFDETQAIEAAYDRQIEAIQTKRQKAFDASREELTKTLFEVQKLATQNAERVAELDQQILGAGFAEQIDQLKSVYAEKESALRESLIKGEITQKEFDKLAAQNQAELNAQTAALDQERLNQVKEISSAITKTKQDAAKAQLDAELFAIESALRADIEALQERARITGVDATALIEARQEQAIQRRTAAQNEFNKLFRDATKEQSDAVKAATNAANDADAKVQADKLERIKEEKAARVELQNAAVSVAGTIASSIIAIEKNRADSQKTAALSAVEAEYKKKIENAQGNAVLEEKLKKELEDKKAVIEREAAQKRKRLAIAEATINGALAVVKALPNFVLAAVTAIATAAQIAVINSQKFAMGGVLKKSGTFGGRPHSRGGTRGVFEDGTHIEVEADEDFIILNKRASAERRRLSALNTRFGGASFADGGIVDFIPQIALPGASSNSVSINAVAGFTDQQIIEIGDKLGGSISSKIAVEVRAALADGLQDADRRLERNNTLTEQRNV